MARIIAALVFVAAVASMAKAANNSVCFDRLVGARTC